jgi:hypothetical protein
MSDTGTLLSELDSSSSNDRDLEDSILSDLNQSSGPHQNAPQPPVGVRGRIQKASPTQSTYPNAADPAVATAHLIGHDHPTEADFQRMVSQNQGPLPFNSMVPQMQQQVKMEGPPKESNYEVPQKNWQGQWIDELKQPIFIAILVFIVTLPAIHLLANHYTPSLLGPGGNFTTIGNVVRSLFTGVLYWILQRVIAPLVSI